MLIFIDESGIHKNVDNSSFVLVYIQIKDYNFLESKIKEIEKKFKIDYFHWSKIPWKKKEGFIDSVLNLDFKVKVAVLKNPINPTIELERILSHMIIEKNIKDIYIDGKKPKWYERKIKKIIRSKNILIKKIRTVDDRQYAGIRLADMIAGLTRSYFDNKNMDKIFKYYKKLEKKIIIILK